jgi:beta-glucosidase
MREATKNTGLTENCSKEVISDYVEKKVLPQLTLDEKLGIMSGQITEEKLLYDLFEIVHYNHDPYPTMAVDRLGVPNMRFVDGPRGVVAGSATCFPVSIARGATFDRELEEEIGKCIGAEVRAVGGNFYGGVCINLLRNPRWGRAQETYGEDSWHIGEMGAALTRGVQSQNVMACIKHFALNSIENARFTADVQVDKRTLHEVYLPHFKKCIEAGAASVMCAYNSVMGSYCSENKYLLKDTLRDRWGFDGFTISDFLWALHEGRAVESVKAGMDIEMPCIAYYEKELPKALEEGRITMEDIDEAVRYIVRTILYYETRKDPQRYEPSVIASMEHIQVAKRAAREAAVLLKNENSVLPLDPEKTQKILVLGKLGDAQNIGDHGSSMVHPYYAVSPLSGIMKRIPGALVLYNDGTNLELAKKQAADVDAVVIVAGYVHSDEGEFLSSKVETEATAGGDRKSMRLHQRDIDAINAVAGICPNTVVALIGSSAILIDEWEEKVPAILLPFYGGMEGGTVLAEILFGDVNPGGKLPYTVALKEDDYPFFDPDCTKITYEYYHGYAKMEKEGKKVLYPYGYGLSYTKFAFGRPEIKVFDNIAKISVDVTNTGSREGADVVQLYVGCEGSTVDRPVKTLRDFQRVDLNAGETRRVDLSVSLKDMAYFSEKEDCFVTENIKYIAYVGDSSRSEDLQKIEFVFE